MAKDAETSSGELIDFLCFVLDFGPDDFEAWPLLLFIGVVFFVVWLARALFQRYFSGEASDG